MNPEIGFESEFTVQNSVYPCINAYLHFGKLRAPVIISMGGAMAWQAFGAARHLHACIRGRWKRCSNDSETESNRVHPGHRIERFTSASASPSIMPYPQPLPTRSLYPFSYSDTCQVQRTYRVDILLALPMIGSTDECDTPFHGGCPFIS